jgi:hypothetical protein
MIIIKSIITHILAEFIIHFIGETESNKLNVIMVGIKIRVSENTLSIAPKPTAIPPRQPIIKIIKLIIPKRLNSVPLYIPSGFSED